MAGSQSVLTAFGDTVGCVDMSKNFTWAKIARNFRRSRARYFGGPRPSRAGLPLWAPLGPEIWALLDEAPVFKSGDPVSNDGGGIAHIGRGVRQRP